MVNSFILPRAILVKEVHLLGNLVGVDHVEIEALVLLEPEEGGGAPVVVWGDRDHVLDWHVDLLDTVQGECVKSQEL